jgi:hypothetical protein
VFDYSFVYDIVYALAARSGRQEKLFGSCAPLAHEAFERSCAGPSFPEVWFELPLAGEPWFDLHVLTARETLEPGMRFEAERTGGYPELFEWFAGAPDARQLALSYDVRSGDIDNPAVQLLVRDERAHEPFLELAGGKGAVESFRSFLQRIPEGWFACYTGIFPGREGAAVRVECIPSEELKRAYALDASLLEAHLQQVGACLGETCVARCQAIAQTPFQIEFQFDVLPGGSLGDTFGMSARFGSASESDDREPFDPNGAAGELMAQLEQWGLADGRWRLLTDTAYCKRIANGGRSVTILMYPAFIKLRWKAGEPLDAKTYLLAAVG